MLQSSINQITDRRPLNTCKPLDRWACGKELAIVRYGDDFHIWEIYSQVIDSRSEVSKELTEFYGRSGVIAPRIVYATMDGFHSDPKVNDGDATPVTDWKLDRNI